MNTKIKPQVGDIVCFKTRSHPTMGKPYEIIGRVESDARGEHAGGRYLSSAEQGTIKIIQSSVERAAPDLLEALEVLVNLNDEYAPFGGEILQDRIEKAWSQARAATAKARGQS